MTSSFLQKGTAPNGKFLEEVIFLEGSVTLKRGVEIQMAEFIVASPEHNEAKLQNTHKLMGFQRGVTYFWHATVFLKMHALL